MNRYGIKFEKTGYIKYTSHLDLLRIFKRAIKKCAIELEYSQGFNPHPKMGFAQPLSLGYTSICEYLEFSTTGKYQCSDLMDRLSKALPEGIQVVFCKDIDDSVKSLAALVDAGKYRVSFPEMTSKMDWNQVLQEYMAQPEIMALKRQKKTKKMIEKDIKNQIRKIGVVSDNPLVLDMVVDCGSSSNLSPEQVIESFVGFADIPVNRYEIHVERQDIFFTKDRVVY